VSTNPSLTIVEPAIAGPSSALQEIREGSGAPTWKAPAMDEAFAKEYLHNDLREVREVMLWKLDGLSEYDVRRPLTSTGTNLLGLVKHLSNTEARYFGDIFGRPFPERLPWWDDDAEFDADKWVTPDETRAEIVDRYRRAWAHADATIDALSLDAPGHVPWWPRPNVKLFNVIIHVLTQTNRHAGHADILREQIDGAVGSYPNTDAPHHVDSAFWAAHRAKIEEAALSTRHDPGDRASVRLGELGPDLQV
jgi:hypothetical protein